MDSPPPGGVDDAWAAGQMTRLAALGASGLAPAFRVAVDRLRTLGRLRALVEVDDATLLHVAPRRAQARQDAVTACVGFPFPVRTRAVRAGVPTRRYAVSLHAHLRPLREHQRRLLRATLEASDAAPAAWHEADPDVFRARVAEALARPADVYYYHDPFRFAGDSVSRLTCRARLAPLVNARTTFSTTCNPAVDGYDGLTYVRPDALAARLRTFHDAAVVAVLPAYIDDQWATTLDVLRALTSAAGDVRIVVPGRNLLIERRPGQRGTRVFHLAAGDVDLWEHPIEEMVDRSLACFARAPEPDPPAPRWDVDGGRVFIHPVTSEAAKDLPVGLTVAIVRELEARLGCGVEVVVGGGVPGNARHAAWCARFARRAVRLRLPRLALVDTLPELARAVDASSFVVTADTVVAHLARASGTPHVVVYNRAWWDPCSRGSLMHHSPLGFCSASACEIPCVTDARVMRTEPACRRRVAASVADCAAFFLRPSTRPRALDAAAARHAERLHALAARPARVPAPGACRGADSGTGWLTAWWDAEELVGHLGEHEATGAQRDALVRRLVVLSPADKARRWLGACA